MYTDHIKPFFKVITASCFFSLHLTGTLHSGVFGADPLSCFHPSEIKARKKCGGEKVARKLVT